MTAPLRVLIVEDSTDDAELLLRELRRGGLEPVARRVQTAGELRAALAEASWDVALCDYSLPGFGAREALEIVAASELDLPFIIVSGTIGEETAVEAMRAGAHDFLIKGKLSRLVPAIQRELREAEGRRRQRAAEESARAAETRFRTLVQSMDDVVFMLDAQQRHVGVYGHWLEREGLSADAFLGKTAREVLGEAAGAAHEGPAARALAGESVTYDWTAPGPGGLRYFQTSLSPIRDANGGVTGVVGVGRETTQTRLLQEQLMVADRMASVGMMAAGVAHEINNPLTVIMANLEMLEREGAHLGPRADDAAALIELVKHAREAGERVCRIARDLRVFSRSEEDATVPLDVEAVVESSLRMAWNEIRHRARVVRDFGHPPLVQGNESRLGQVFLNLLVNAAQAIRAGDASSNEIRVTTRQAGGGRAVVEIADTGAGIPPEILARLFTPFVTTKPRGVGTGLGLSLCKRLVTQLGGEIRVETAQGKGTTFHVELPLADRPVTGAAAPRVQALAAGRHGRVLVVDDELLVGMAVKRLLSLEHEVAVETTGTGALARILEGQRFDVILSDLMMPDMAGMDLHAAVLRVAPEQAERIVFLTGGAFTPEARAFLEAVPNGRMAKPFDPRELRTLVNARVPN